MALCKIPPDNNGIISDGDSTAGLSNDQGATGGAHDDQSLCSAALLGGIVITELSLPSDMYWPADLILDWQKSNWQEWSRQLNIMVDKHAFTDWLDGSIPCPGAATHARASQIWKINDCALRTFMLERVSHTDHNIVCELPNSHTIYKALRHRHQRFELEAQVLLISEGLDIRFRPGVRLSDTLNVIDKLHTRITDLGPMDEAKINDHLLTVLLWNSLEEHLPGLHSRIDYMLDKAFSSSRDVIRRLRLEEDLHIFRAQQGLPPVASEIPAYYTPTATSAKGKKKTRPFCANCKRRSHSTDFCVLPGGKMAGRTIEEAHAAQLVASGKLPRGNQG